MTRSRPRPAAEVDFSTRSQAEAWFRFQPSEVCIALAPRSALRVLPLIDAGRSTPDFASRVALSVLRACFVAWALAEYPSLRDRLRRPAARAYDIDRPDAVAIERGRSAGQVAAAVAAARAAVGAATTATPAAVAAARAAAAAAAAAPAAAAARAAASTQADAAAIEHGRTIDEIVDAPLWSGTIPEQIVAAWDRLRPWMLKDEANYWDPCVQWYERVRDGRPSFGQAFDLAVASLTDAQWNEEPVPAAVNRRIAALLAEHTTPDPIAPPEPIPPQGPGPHVIINAAGKLDQAPPEDIDAEGNNLARIRQLLPVQRGAVADLLAHLASTDAFSQLASVVRDYRDAIAEDETRIAWGAVFGLGVRLDNAAVAAKRQIDDRLAPSLEDAALEALDTVVRLHGPLILSTRDGRELSDIADDFARRPEQQAGMRQDAEAIVAGFRNRPKIIEPNFKRLVEGAAEAVGKGNRPERGAASWRELARNLATMAVPAAALGALVAVLANVSDSIGAGSGAAIGAASSVFLQENARTREALRALGAEYNRLADAVLGTATATTRIREAARALGAEYNRLVEAALDTARDQADLARAQAIARLRLLTPFRDFVIANEEPLRRIAAYSPSLR